MSRGYVYVLSNPAMPGLVKVGRTTRRVSARAEELYQTGVPSPFVVEDYVYSPDCDELELWFHEACDQVRHSSSREFFRMEAPEAIESLRELHTCQVSYLVEEFAPDHALLPDHIQKLASLVEGISKQVNAPEWVVSEVISEVTAKELIPASERVQKRWDAKAAAENAVLIYRGDEASK